MPLQAGNLVNNRYRIERILGQGGMGAVYLAQDETLGVPVAVKENLNVSPESERQFKREATLLAGLRHAHLPRVTDHFVLGGQQYLVMDYVEGEDLKERLRRLGPLPAADVVRWGTQICDALIYLHGLNPPVVHRDIKPGNIKLDAAGDAMLVDFGIAKAASSGQKTTTGAAAFTPGYAPPEQYGLGRTDPRTDQYALAATLYHLLTNQTPPDSMEQLLGNAALTPPEQLRPDLSPALAGALTHALALKPEQRFENVARFKEVMLGRGTIDILTRPGGAAETRVAGTPPAAGPARKGPAPAAPARPAWLMPAALGAAALFVIGAAAAAYAFLSKPAAPPTATAPAPTAAVTATIAPATATALPPSATPVPSATPAPATPTAVPPTAAPTDTATAVPPTAAPAGPALGGGGRVAFISNRDGKNFQVYTMNPDGADLRPVTTDPTDKWSPKWQLGRLGPFQGGTFLAWSPDGQQLIYSAETTPGGPIDLFVINADGSNPQNLTAPATAGRPNENDFQPAWCVDGTLAFTSLRNNSPQIFIIQNLGNREARNYSTTRSNPLEYNPLFFPDCRRMLVISTQNGAGELWRLFPSKQAMAQMWGAFPAYPGANNENSYREFLSEKPQGNVILDAALSPDGTLFAYTRQSPGSLGNNIVLGTVESSPLLMKFQQLTEGKSDTSPRWSPDGKYLVFVSRRAGGVPQIFRMTAAGNDETNLSAAAGAPTAAELSPVWQPAPAPPVTPAP